MKTGKRSVTMNGGSGGRREEEMNRQSKGDFQSSGTITFDAAIVDTCPCTFATTHRIYKTESKSYCKLWT